MMLVRGAEPMEKRQRRSLWKNANGAAYGKTPTAQPFPGSRFLLTCFFWLYPLILWITASPLLSEQTPLAAAERPSVASQ